MQNCHQKCTTQQENEQKKRSGLWCTIHDMSSWPQYGRKQGRMSCSHCLDQSLLQERGCLLAPFSQHFICCYLCYYSACLINSYFKTLTWNALQLPVYQTFFDRTCWGIVKVLSCERATTYKFQTACPYGSRASRSMVCGFCLHLCMYASTSCFTIVGYDPHAQNKVCSFWGWNSNLTNGCFPYSATHFISFVVLCSHTPNYISFLCTEHFSTSGNQKPISPLRMSKYTEVIAFVIAFIA